MITLIDIEPGMVVAGRYVVSTVDRPWIEEQPEVGAVCTAIDAILDEPVLIHVADSHGSGDVLDAARRVSILGDPRIAPTLDVGHSNGLDYIVSKLIVVNPVGEILPESPLPVDAARALIGEVGTVLVAGARRGLFHMFLSPSTVGITTSGRVIVSGIGIDSALAQGNGVIQAHDYTPTKAARKDALDLVRLYYAAVTGHWPGDDAVGGIPASGRENSRIVRAKSLNPEIDHQLDDFISGILTGSDPGPGSVAEVLGYLDDWDPQILRYVKRAPARDTDAIFDSSPRSFDEATSLPEPRSKSIGGAIGADSQTTASDDQVQAALVRIGITRPGTRGLAAGVSGKSTGRYAERMQMREASSFPIGASQIDDAAKEWDEWEPEQTYSQYSSYADREHDANLTSPILDRDAQDQEDPDTQALDIVVDEDDNDTRVLLDEEDDGSWFLGGMFETSEQQRAHQLREYERERRIAESQEEDARRRIRAAEAAAASHRAESAGAAPAKPIRRLSPNNLDESAAAAGAIGADAGSSAATDNGSTVKVADARSDRSTPPNQARTAAPAAAAASSSGGGSAGPGASDDGSGSKRKPFLWIVLALVVVVAIIIGFFVFNMNTGADPDDVAQTPAATTPAEEKSEEPKEEPQAVPPEIDKVTALDPEGDDEENDDQAEKVISGEKGSWRTDRYNSPEFGNLKSGVGLLLELKDKTTVKEVEVKSSSSGGTFEIRAGDDPADAKKVGEGEFDKDGVTVELDEGVETDALIVWITELPDADGGYRASINTINLK